MKKSIVILLHVGYWITYITLFFIFYSLLSVMGDFLSGGGFAFQGLNSFIFFGVFAFLPAALAFYGFYHYVFNRFLGSKNILRFIMYALGFSLLCSVFGYLILCIIWTKIAPPNLSIIRGGMEEVIGMNIMMWINAMLSGVIGFIMKGFINWYDDLKIKKELTQKNYEMEMALVKSQMNPHFLFNTINNIDVLIGKNPEQASDYLHKLSDIMRFSLYETNNDKVSLQKELSYIEKFTELQKIRNSNKDYIRYTVSGNPENREVAPMIFIPFIENAFKYAENKKAENAVRIDIEISRDKIVFICENAYSTSKQMTNENGGLGNELIKKRLQLLYPKNHTLFITDKNDIYQVKLIIENHAH